MTPSIGSYIGGSLSLVVIVVALGFGAFHLRSWIVPRYTGALARLAELVLAAAAFVLILQVLGSFGLLRAGWIPAACAIAGVGSGLLARAKARAAGPADPISAPRASRVGLLIAVGVVSWTVAEWSLPTLLSLDRGMFGGDSVWYHMPTSARFAQEGSIVSLHFTDPLQLAVWYYPHTYELLNGAGIAMFDSDFLASLMNLGWLAVGFLAAWCVGRPYGLGPATVVCAGLVFNSGLMWETQAGEARNDMMTLALLLALAAFLLNGREPESGHAGVSGDAVTRWIRIDTGSLVLIGVAGGLAVSTKLTMLLPVGIVVLGVILFREPAARRRTLAVLGGALLVTGAYWYGRNLMHAGNPLPLLQALGPIDLPGPEQMQLFPRPPHSVAGYLLDPSIYRHWFIPQLDNALGPLWPLLIAGGLASAVFALRERDSVIRILAAAALITAIVYILTPIGASGPEGQPKGFFTNTRYLMAALLFGLILVPLARPLRESLSRRNQVLGALCAAFAATTVATLPWFPGYLVGALVITAAVVWLPIALARLRLRGRMGRGAVACAAFAALALALVLGRAQEAQLIEQRYADPEPFFREAGPVAAFDWAREVRDSRVGVVGAGQVFFTQYGWYGADLSNHVQYVGVEGPNGAFRLARTCGELRASVNAGNYDYLVTTRFGTDTARRQDFPVWGWLRGDNALGKLLTERVYPQQAWVYEVTGELDPGACGEDTQRRQASKPENRPRT